MAVSQLSVLLPTLWRLGLGAVATVAAYRLACWCGIYRCLLPIREAASGGLFFDGTRDSPQISLESKQKLLAQADAMLAGEFTYFSKCRAKIGSPPDWFLDPFRNRRIEQAGHWSTFDEFADGDIKIIWEPSRFGWMPFLAQAWQISGEDRYLAALNNWLQDWVKHNPPNTSPNWKCGQETSIRMMNLLLTSRLLRTHRQSSKELISLVTLHCERIRATIRYAVAQNNNHGTSEAAALFVGGAWLASHAGRPGVPHRARLWRDAGRRWLEERVARLVEADGSFSQYSVTYHRVLVDTLNQVELWRRELSEAPFSKLFYTRCRAAVEWLATMTNAHTGDAPNLGANDGARLYDLSATEYRDFRPSVQLAMALFCNRCAYADEGSWNLPLHWLGIPVPAEAAAPVRSVQFPQGGYSVLRRGEYFAFLRFPMFRFRPSQADALHVDLWAGGQNLLRDGGTYSYNAGDEVIRYFGGTAGHNTVQFDDRDQMPRLSRFLFGDWLKAKAVIPVTETGSAVTAAAGYVDGQGASHHRKVTLSDRSLQVADKVSGFRKKAVLRWRLLPGDWKLNGNTVRLGEHALRVTASVPIVHILLIQGWESRYYLKKEPAPVLEVEIQQPGLLETEISWID